MIKSIIKSLLADSSKILDEVITTDEERLKAKHEIKSLLKNHEQTMYQLEVEDRKSARTMYHDDSIIQKILATLFTIAYFILSFVMFRYFMIGDINLGEFEITFISTIFGAMSTKVSTICDFYFGGSTKKDK